MRGYAAIGLYQPKTPANIGAVLRAVGVYDAAMLVVSGKRYKKSNVDTPKQWRHTPFIQTQDLLSVIPYGCVPVAVDILPGARTLQSDIHPEQAYYIFGPEDGMIPKEIVQRCRDVVYVNTPGPCMNLAATVNVVLYDRYTKRGIFT